MNDSRNSGETPSQPLADAPPAPPTFSKLYLGYALAIIVAANLLNYLDRTVVSGLEHEINENLGLTEADEWKFGLLWTAFTVGYMFTSPIIGFWADRWSRVRIFGVCVLIWSIATVGCGIAKDYWLFVALRVLIGVGEAGCLVIGPTLLADYFPRKYRGRVLAVLFLGTPIGGALGFITAGKAGWPGAFWWAGLPGIPIAVLLFFLREPERGGSEEHDGGHHHHAPAGASLSSYLALLKSRTLLFIILAQAFAAFTLVPLMHFGTKFFENLNVPKATVTTRLGILVVLGGIGGAVVGGMLGDRLGKKDPGAYSLLAAIGFFVGFPSTILGMHLAPHPASYFVLALAFTMFFMCMPLVNTQIANVVPANQRALAYAAAVFILHILGDTLSPPLFGFISSQLGANGRLIAFTIFPFSLLFSSACCLLAWRFAQSEAAES